MTKEQIAKCETLLQYGFSLPPEGIAAMTADEVAIKLMIWLAKLFPQGGDYAMDLSFMCRAQEGKWWAAVTWEDQGFTRTATRVVAAEHGPDPLTAMVEVVRAWFNKDADECSDQAEV